MLHIITGPMFAGKTETLIGEYLRAKRKKLKVILFRPKMDDRFNDKNIATHSMWRTPENTIWVETVGEIQKNCLLLSPDVICIDETHFFGVSLLPMTMDFLHNYPEVKLIYAGLNRDFLGEPFGNTPALMALSDKITLITSVCSVDKCQYEATYSQRIDCSEEQIVVGGADKYKPVCEHHFTGKYKALQW